MPANFIQDEDIWASAKKVYGKEPKTDEDFAKIVVIYKKMNGRIKGQEKLLEEANIMFKEMQHYEAVLRVNDKVHTPSGFCKILKLKGNKVIVRCKNPSGDFEFDKKLVQKEDYNKMSIQERLDKIEETFKGKEFFTSQDKDDNGQPHRHEWFDGDLFTTQNTGKQVDRHNHKINQEKMIAEANEAAGVNHTHKLGKDMTTLERLENVDKGFEEAIDKKLKLKIIST